jgi:hypothetical protein
MRKTAIREMTVNGPALVLWGRGTGRASEFLFETYRASDKEAIKRADTLGIACASIPAGSSMSFPVPVSN